LIGKLIDTFVIKIFKMDYANNILETIGNTPLIKLNTITAEVDALVLAKVESFNPGNSVKDRMAVKMIEDAEADGRLKAWWNYSRGNVRKYRYGFGPGGNSKRIQTNLYFKLICVSTDKQSKEKFDILRAVGAKVIVCPTDVAPEDPQVHTTVLQKE
jgi:cystathionine beta-synthase